MIISRAILSAAMLFALPVLAEPERDYRIDLTRYFASDAAEASARQTLFAEVGAFTKEKPRDAAALEAYLDHAQKLLADLQRHGDYLLLLFSIDIHNRAASAAGDEVSAEKEQIKASVEATLIAAPPKVKQSPSLARFSYEIEKARRDSAHLLPPDQQLVLDSLGEPTLSNLYSLYTATARSTPFAKIGSLDARADRKKLMVDPDPAVRAAARKAFWDGYASRGPVYASVLLSIVDTETRIAKLRHFDSAPEAKYSHALMSVADVKATLDAIAAHAALNKRFQASELAHVKAQTGLAVVHSWDLNAPMGGFTPPRFSIAEIRAAAHQALAPLGPDYVARMDALLNPANHRLDLASGDANRDAGGFSVGSRGQVTGLFVGNFDGSTNAAGTLVHEGGHAIHRSYMNDAAVPQFYANGPNWMFEAFAILNQFLLYDHLAASSADPRAKAYYLGLLTEDMAFQLFGSAEEGTLEQEIYDQVTAGKIKTADDFDALTQSVLDRYDLWPQTEPEQRHVWMGKILIYMDPLYLVNYLYAGLLAAKLYDMALDDPADFQRRYTALLSGGFAAPPDVLLSRFFGRKTITADLIPGAVAILEKRVNALEDLQRQLDGDHSR